MGGEGRKSMEEYDITLMSPPSRMINHYRPPMGLMYIGGYLKTKGLMEDYINNEYRCFID